MFGILSIFASYPSILYDNKSITKLSDLSLSSEVEVPSPVRAHPRTETSCTKATTSSIRFVNMIKISLLAIFSQLKLLLQVNIATREESNKFDSFIYLC